MAALLVHEAVVLALAAAAASPCVSPQARTSHWGFLFGFSFSFPSLRSLLSLNNDPIESAKAFIPGLPQACKIVRFCLSLKLSAVTNTCL